LRCGSIQDPGAIEPVDLDEYSAGLLGAAPTHRREYTLDGTTTKICRDPNAGLQSHQLK
jgi:hypothetical protein